MSARHVGGRELTCEADGKGANLFVSVLACELFSRKTACRDSATGSALCPQRHVRGINQQGGDMQERNLLEDLVAVSPGMEIWWDSSPVIFDNWCKKMLAKADAGDQDNLKRQFKRMYDTDDPAGQLFRGVTTNPPLSLAAIKDDPASWQKVAEQILKENDGLDTEGLFWLLYKEVVRQGSAMFLPLFEASGYKQGFLSGQVDPRNPFDAEAMLAQALEVHAVNPNVMVKVPGTAEGYGVIEELTSRGIATNNTLTFVLPQLMDCAKTVKRGLEKAKANVVVTCPPSLIDEVINFPDPEDIKFQEGRIDVDPPKEVMDKLMRIPYFERAYAEDGYTRDEYNTHPALVKTAEAFSKATNDMVAFAGSCFADGGP